MSEIRSRKGNTDARIPQDADDRKDKSASEDQKSKGKVQKNLAKSNSNTFLWWLIPVVSRSRISSENLHVLSFDMFPFDVTGYHHGWADGVGRHVSSSKVVLPMVKMLACVPVY